MITAAGGTAIARRVNHTNEADVKALFRRILRAHRRLDIVVDSVAGEDPLMRQVRIPVEADLNLRTRSSVKASRHASSRPSTPPLP